MYNDEIAHYLAVAITDGWDQNWEGRSKLEDLIKRFLKNRRESSLPDKKNG